MKLVDVHAHLDFDPMGQGVEGMIKRAEEAGLVAVVANGTGSESNRNVLALAETYSIVRAALGVYPLDAVGLSEAEFDRELKFIEEMDPFAIGEIGIDFKDGREESEHMTRCFGELVSLAKKLDVPVLVHSRKAEKETIDALEALGHTKVILHCFSGKMSLVHRAIEYGWFFSIPAIVKRSQHFQTIVEITPIEQLLTETDSPFLPPDPSMEQNEPAFVKESVSAMADIKGISDQEVADAVLATYRELFGDESVEDRT